MMITYGQKAHPLLARYTSRLALLQARILGLQLPPRRQNHLLAPPLQRSLPLVPIRAPPFALLVRFRGRRWFLT